MTQEQNSPQNTQHKGLFITLEGGEGSGKSTQAFRVADHLRLAGLRVLVTREPGGSEVGERIREILVSGDVDRCLPETELLLVTAARLEHLQKVIYPAIEQGTYVICDRFFHSTLVYQCYVQGIEEEVYYHLHRTFLHNVMPDLTFFFDIPVEMGLKRTKTRQHQEDRFEKKSLDFHEKIRKGFLEQQEKSGENGILINATHSQHDITKNILQEILGYLKK